MVTTMVHLPSCSLLQGSGDSSLEKEFLGAPVGPSVSTPNSQHSSPSRSLSGKCTLLPSPGTRHPCLYLALDSSSISSHFPNCCLPLVSRSESLKALRSSVSRVFLTSERRMNGHCYTRLELKAAWVGFR